jgi:predicted ABC-type ATPase
MSELLLSRIRELVAARATFSFETTLAARSYRTSILEWRRLGYRVVLYFIWLLSAEMAINRVASRVQEGGHDIPEAIVRRRYTRGLTNLFELYAPIVSNAYVFDGTAFLPILVAEINGEDTLVLDYNRWELIIRQRTDEFISVCVNQFRFSSNSRQFFTNWFRSKTKRRNKRISALQADSHVLHTIYNSPCSR